MTKSRTKKPSGRPRKVAAAPKIEPPKPVETVPRAPSWLGKQAKSEWRRSAAQLAERRVLTPGDLGTLEAYCAAKGRLAECEAILRTEGITTKGQDGVVVRHPAVGIAAQSMLLVKQLAAQLGLTPASRRRAATELPAGGADGRWGGLVDG